MAVDLFEQAFDEQIWTPLVSKCELVNKKVNIISGIHEIKCDISSS